MIISDRKPIKILINLSCVTIFQVKIQHKTINLSFCVIFASIKLLRQDIPKNNYRLNDTINLFCCVVSFRVFGQKSATADPYCTMHHVSLCWKNILLVQLSTYSLDFKQFRFQAHKNSVFRRFSFFQNES